MKKIIKICLIITLCISTITGCKKNNKNTNNQEKLQENTKVINSQVLDNLKFEVKSLKCENDVSILNYSITNIGEEEVKIPNYKMKFMAGEKTLYILRMNYNEYNLLQNETKDIQKEIKSDLTSATSITFELIKDEKIDSD